MMSGPWPTARTRFAGVIGWPVDHSLSPSMHNAAFRALELDWAYLAFPIHPDDVDQAVRGLFRAGCAGLNVTIPHKQSVLACCDEVTPAVQAIGAANTLVPIAGGGIRGDNTDAEGARLKVANRTAERAAELGEPVEFSRAAVERAAQDAVLVVNATSLGMGSEDVPPELPIDSLGPGTVAYDIVYRREPTPWLAAAAARGARTVDGLGMLLHQGAAAFVQWTGAEPPLQAMRNGLLAG